MIVFETEEEFKAAVVNILQGLSIRVSDYSGGWYDRDVKGVEVSLWLDGDCISTDGAIL